MVQFAANLEEIAPTYIRNADVLDATGLEGAWDFTINFSPGGASSAGQRVDSGSASAAAAAEPNGVITLFEALEKQLGLKLETTKRPGPVLVIDHMEQQPTDN